MPKKKPKVPAPDEIKALQAEIAARTAHVLESKQMQSSELIREVNAVYPSFNEIKLRYLVQLQLIPQRKAANNYHYFLVDDLRTILLVLALRDKDRPWRIPSYSNIFGILIQTLKRDPKSTTEVPVSHTQRERGLFIWRSSLVRYLLFNLFDGELPTSTFVFLYKPRRSILEHGEKSAPWLKVDPLQFNDVSYRLKDSRHMLVTSDDGNVFHWFDEKGAPQSYEYDATWYRIEGGGRHDPSDYEVVIAVPDGNHACRAPQQAEVITLLLRLIDGCFLESGDIDRPEHHALSALDVVTSLTTKMSPFWQYCDCFAPDARTPDLLATQLASKQYPLGGQKAVQIGVGQLLSGRAYQEGHPIVVQRALETNDPRIAEDRPTAAAAVPTLYHGQVNGVLYVATHKTPPSDPAFSEVDIKLLQILGLLAGQLLGADKALTQSSQMSRNIIDAPALTDRPWDELRVRLTELMAYIKASSTAARSKDSIHLVSVQVTHYDKLVTRFPEVAKWAVEQLYASAVRYFIERGISPPEIYTRSPHEFLLLLPKVHSNDAGDRRLREELRARLNSLSLVLPGKGESVPVACDLWSLPFRYAELLRFDGDEQKQVDAMIASAEEAFIFLPFVYLAHQYEREGAWPKAHDQYRLAYRLVPNNLYLLRHLAKAQTQLQRFQEAVNGWNQMIAEHKHPSHYRRLAYNLVALGTEEGVEQATIAIKKAISLDERDAKNYATAASIYTIAGRPDDAIAALELAAAYDQDNAARYLLNIADIHYANGRYNEVWDTCIVAQTHNPDDHVIPDKMMRAAWAMNRATTLST